MKKKRLTKRSIVPKAKKAVHPSTLIFYEAVSFLFAGLVIYLFIRIAYTGAKSDQFKKEFFAKDIGLMTDTIYAVPGDVEYDYLKDPSKFVLDFRRAGFFVYSLIDTANKDKVDLGELGKASIQFKSEEGKLQADIVESNYVYLSHPKNPFVKIFTFPATLSFKKKGSILEISSTGIFNDEKYCPDADTENRGKTAIDPGEYEGSGLETPSRKEHIITSQIAKSLEILCKSHSMECTILEQKPMDEKLKQLRETNPDMTISIHIGNFNNPDDSPFRAMYSLENIKAERLACTTGNAFRKDYSVLEPVKVDMSRVRNNDYRAALSEEVPSIVIEIGNINNPKNFDENSDFNEIASSIIKGIDDYFRTEPEEEPKPEEEKPKEPLSQTTDTANLRITIR